MSVHKKFWTEKRRERALVGGLGAALLVIIYLLLRKHLVNGPQNFGGVNVGAPGPVSLAPIYNINGGNVPAASLDYHPGNFSYAYPKLADPPREGGCCCGCDDKASTFTNGLAANMNNYMVGIAAAENLYTTAIYGQLPPAIAQYIGNSVYTSVGS